MGADDRSADQDRKHVSEIPCQYPQNPVVSLDHPVHHSGGSHRTKKQTQRRRGRHPSFLGRYGGNTANQQGNEDVPDVYSCSGEEYVQVEVMFRNLVSNKNCEYGGLHQPPKQQPR